jgi:tetratricopeptide (TPR) repeat protein
MSSLVLQRFQGSVRPVVLAGLATAFLVLLAGGTAWYRYWRGHQPGPKVTPTSSSAMDYVGDSACADCHPTQAVGFRRHPMGRSVASVASPASLERFDAKAHDPLTIGGFQFAAEQTAGRMFHSVTRADSHGRVLCASRAEVQFAIGSGTRGRSYVIDREGFLFQSPLSWYSATQTWGLSPHRQTAGELLYRPIQDQCLFCHCNTVTPVEHTVNHYREPIVADAIGCERCHGPGGVHVRLHQEQAEVSLNEEAIVNPRRLNPTERDAVCQQCHLLGVARVIRHGRQPFDFRPGMPLGDIWTVFVQAPDAKDGYRLVSQVEQLAVSRCFRASAGKMGCNTCHDPHALPPVKTRGDYFRNQCLQCHQETSCGLAPAKRRLKNAGDHCTACHMLPIQSSDIGHMAFTDHRILRNPEAAGRTPDSGATSREEVHLVPFGMEDIPKTNPELARARGLALVELAGLKRQEPARVQAAQQALPLLAAAVQREPADVAAWQAKGYALWLAGRPRDGLMDLQTALALAPEREEALMYAAGLSAHLEQWEAALDYWHRALKVNPCSVRYHFELARLLGRLRRWPDALAECTATLDLDPLHLEARKLLIICQLRLGQRDQAQHAWEDLRELDPTNRDRLESWFQSQEQIEPK